MLSFAADAPADLQLTTRADEARLTDNSVPSTVTKYADLLCSSAAYSQPV